MESTGLTDVFQLAGTVLEGRFAVERVVAEGGFGLVYHAHQAALERPVALKVLKTPPRYDEAASQQFLADFAAEARTVARITHPSIVLVYDFGVSTMPSGERAAWMALEWLTGITLDEELFRRRGRGGRSPVECLELLRPVVSALAVVHAAGVAHRDIKPANIMLVQGPGGVVTPKLLDFGIAKVMTPDELPGSGTTRTRSTQIAFSPGYASPEQISQGRSGPWTDVHAIGLMMAEVLTDRPMLEGDDLGLLYQQIVDRTRPTPAKYGVDVGSWEPVLARAMAVAAKDRYRDASELLHALEAALPRASREAVSGGSFHPPRDRIPSFTALDAAGLMPTQRATAQAARDATTEPPRRGHVTTETPLSTDGPSTRLRTGARPATLVSGAIVAVALAGVGWRAMDARRPDPLATPTAAGASATPLVPSASAAASPPSAAPAPPPAPSAPPSVSVAPPPSRAPGRHPPASAPARPRAPDRVIIE